MIRERFQSFIEYFFIFFLVFFSQDTLLFGTNSSTLAANILYASLPVAIVIFFLYTMLIFKKVTLNRKLLKVAVLLCGFSLLTMIISEQTFSFKYGYECLMIVFSLMLCSFISFDSFRIKFCKIIIFLSCFSLICFSLHYIYPRLISFFPVITNEAGYKFYCLFFANVPFEYAYITFRNYGIFREPSVYQVFLNLALILYFSDNIERKPLWHFFALIATIITTFSTSGYILCFLVVFFHFVKRILKIKIKTTLIIIATCSCAVILFLWGKIDFDQNIFSKLFSSNASSNARIGSFLVNIVIGFQNLILGKGYAYTENNFYSIALRIFNMDAAHNTNTLLKMFSVHGAIYSGIYYVGYLRFFKKLGLGAKWIIYCFIFFLSLSSADLIFNTTIYIIMFYGYKTSFTYESKKIIGN